MGEYIPVAFEVLFVMTVAFKTVQEALDVQRKRLELKQERQKQERQKQERQKRDGE